MNVPTRQVFLSIGWTPPRFQLGAESCPLWPQSDAWFQVSRVDRLIASKLRKIRPIVTFLHLSSAFRSHWIVATLVE